MCAFLPPFGEDFSVCAFLSPFGEDFEEDFEDFGEHLRNQHRTRRFLVLPSLHTSLIFPFHLLLFLKILKEVICIFYAILMRTKKFETRL